MNIRRTPLLPLPTSRYWFQSNGLLPWENKPLPEQMLITIYWIRLHMGPMILIIYLVNGIQLWINDELLLTATAWARQVPTRNLAAMLGGNLYVSSNEGRITFTHLAAASTINSVENWLRLVTSSSRSLKKIEHNTSMNFLYRYPQSRSQPRPRSTKPVKAAELISEWLK